MKNIINFIINEHIWFIIIGIFVILAIIGYFAEKNNKWKEKDKMTDDVKNIIPSEEIFNEENTNKINEINSAIKDKNKFSDNNVFISDKKSSEEINPEKKLEVFKPNENIDNLIIKKESNIKEEDESVLGKKVFVSNDDNNIKEENLVDVSNDDMLDINLKTEEKVDEIKIEKPLKKKTKNLDEIQKELDNIIF